MALTPAAVEAEVDDRPLKVQVASAVRDFILNYDVSALTETQSQGGSQTPAPEKLSLLTLRPLAEGDEPEEITSYHTPVGAHVGTALADADIALGAADDPLEARVNAGKDVRSIENATAYVDGAVPEPVSQDDFDDWIDALHEKASNYRPDML